MPRIPGPLSPDTEPDASSGGDIDDAGGTTAGLSTAEVAERRAAGLGNEVTDPTTRTYGQIVRANVFTRFNALLGVLLVAILAVREYRDALFGIVLVLNTLIGIVQEARAKRTLDRLRVLNAPVARVRRDGATIEVPVAELVTDDVVELGPGDQIAVDGHVLDSRGLEVDESLLTGEADPEPRHPGDDVLSGSFVAAGSGVIRATGVGDDAYAYRLQREASRFSLVRSELRAGIDRILQVITWLMLPTAALLVAAQVRYQHSLGDGVAQQTRVTDAVQASVAGLVAMVPEGLVLLTSLAFALGVIRLGRRQVLTQELAAIEGLARVDVICLDKTGTLTEGHLRLDDVDLLGRQDDPGAVDEAGAALAALVAVDPNPNASLRAVGDRFGQDPGWTAEAVVPFSSARKWSGATFTHRGSWLLGAPDVLLPDVLDPDEARPAGADPGASSDPVERDLGAAARARVAHDAAEGRRLILLACSPEPLDGERLPGQLRPVAVVVLDERLRPDAPDTIRYFLDQDVQVKVISGDSPVTVGAVARRVGVPGAEDPVDARTLPPEEDLDALADVLERHTVFGRVTPQQKRAMVHALQSRNHEVAMTGDGVNDTLALKDAEIGVAMGTGSPAARSVARFVLLDNSFAVFPSVVAEGRRVIANIERVANLFLTKTVYALLLALVVGVSGLPYPFVPRHLTVVSSLTIGIPAFFLALAPNDQRARPHFLSRVLRLAVPAGLVAGVATFLTFLVARAEGDELIEARTAATIVLFAVALWVLALAARPWMGWRGLLVLTMGGLFVAVLALPATRRYFELDWPSPDVLVVSAGIVVAAAWLIDLARRRLGPEDDPGPEGDHRPDAAAGVGRTTH